MFQLPSLFKIRAVALVAGFFLLFWLIGFVKWCFAAPYQCYAAFDDWNSITVGYNIAVWNSATLDTNTNVLSVVVGTIPAGQQFRVPNPSGTYKSAARVLWGWDGTMWKYVLGDTTQRHYSVSAVDQIKAYATMFFQGESPVAQYPAGCTDPCPDQDNDDIEDSLDPFPNDPSPFTWGIEELPPQSDGMETVYRVQIRSSGTGEVVWKVWVGIAEYPPSAGQLVYDQGDWKAIYGTCSESNPDTPLPPVNIEPPVETIPEPDLEEVPDNVNNNPTNQALEDYLRDLVQNSAQDGQRLDNISRQLSGLHDLGEQQLRTQASVGNSIVGSVKSVKTSVDALGSKIDSVGDGIDNLNTSLGSLIDSLGQLNDKLNGTYVPENISNDYVNTSVENVSEFTGRLNTLISDLRSSALFSLPNQVLGNIPSGGTPIYTVSMGQYGSADIDLAEYDGVFAIVRAVLLVCFSFASLRIVVSHR